MLFFIRVFISLIVFLGCSSYVLSWNDAASSKVIAYLPTTMSIDSVYIDNQKISNVVKSPKLGIKEVISVEEGVNQLRLSSIRYLIKTNTYNPVQVMAEFVSLTNSTYSFSQENLSLETKYQSDIEESKTEKLSPKFTPLVNVTSEVPSGNYDGTIILTISSL